MLILRIILENLPPASNMREAPKFWVCHLTNLDAKLKISDGISERALMAHDFFSRDKHPAAFANFVGSPSSQLLLLIPVMHCNIKLYNFSTRREFKAECFLRWSKFPSLRLARRVWESRRGHQCWARVRAPGACIDFYPARHVMWIAKTQKLSQYSSRWIIFPRQRPTGPLVSLSSWKIEPNFRARKWNLFHPAFALGFLNLRI